MTSPSGQMPPFRLSRPGARGGVDAGAGRPGRLIRGVPRGMPTPLSIVSASSRTIGACVSRVRACPSERKCDRPPSPESTQVPHRSSRHEVRLAPFEPKAEFLEAAGHPTGTVPALLPRAPENDQIVQVKVHVHTFHLQLCDRLPHYFGKDPWCRV
ncbi:hypothetical protein BC828DRAFT_71891 [Blastocladiella britannica]|nr:hypothetical protein BC828DRAFT_71891 [Blastocladiella britannica]